MYSNHYNQRVRLSQHDTYLRCNSVVVAILTIILTSLVAYFLAVIATSSTLKKKPFSNGSEESLESTRWLNENAGEQFKTLNYKPAEVAHQHRNDFGKVDVPLEYLKREHQNVVRPVTGWQPLVEASEVVTSRVLKPPDNFVGKSERLRGIRDQLNFLQRNELLQLIRILQKRVDEWPIVSIKKRHIEQSPTLTNVSSSSRESESSLPKEPVVIRSSKMNRLVAYLDKIQSNIPPIDVGKLEKLAALDDEKSIVRIVAPGTVDAVLKANSSSQDSDSRTPYKANTQEIVSWRERRESVAPTGDFGDWPQEQVEDWPVSSTTVRPRKKKIRKKVVVSTTSTTTTTTLAPETTTTPPTIPPSSPTPPQAFEEVWIEEEEEIIRPPRRKSKKYKKKPAVQETTTLAPTTTTTSTTTTTTTTTTTPAPTIQTTTLAPEEDWPDDPWPQASSTKSPELWPQQPVEEEKWPEEEWLDELKNDVQKRIHVIYN